MEYYLNVYYVLPSFFDIPLLDRRITQLVDSEPVASGCCLIDGTRDLTYRLDELHLERAKRKLTSHSYRFDVQPMRREIEDGGHSNEQR